MGEGMGCIPGDGVFPKISLGVFYLDPVGLVGSHWQLKEMGVEPKIVVVFPPNHPWINEGFPWFSPSILGETPLFLETSRWNRQWDMDKDTNLENISGWKFPPGDWMEGMGNGWNRWEVGRWNRDFCNGMDQPCWTWSFSPGDWLVVYSVSLDAFRKWQGVNVQKV